LEGSGGGLFEVASWDLPGGIEKNQKSSIKVAGVLAEIQTEHSCFVRWISVLEAKKCKLNCRKII
jgi:hypothetical protein